MACCGYGYCCPFVADITLPPFGCNLLASLPLLPWLWVLLGVSWPRQSLHLYLAGVELLLSAPAVVICRKISLVGPFSRLHPIPSDGHTSQHRQQSVARKRARLFCNTVTNPRRAHRVWATQRSRQSIIFFQQQLLVGYCSSIHPLCSTTQWKSKHVASGGRVIFIQLMGAATLRKHKI